MNEREPVTKVLEAYKTAVYAKDIDAFVALYDQDVRIFDMWGRWSFDGAEEWRGMVTGWFGSLGTERVEVSFDDVQMTLAQDIAVAHAFVTYKGMSASGEALRAMQNRTTIVLEQRSGTWKIVHEHSSAPADFETLKVNLEH